MTREIIEVIVFLKTYPATRTLRHQYRPLDRETLRQPIPKLLVISISPIFASNILQHLLHLVSRQTACIADHFYRMFKVLVA